MPDRDPAALLYSESHEWLAVDGAKAFVGITDHAQHELGDIVFVELVAAGTKLDGGASFGSLESVKAVSELYLPVTGTVVRVNEAVVAKPETLNADPYGAGWLVEIELGSGGTAGLMDAAAYEEFLRA